MVSIEWQKKYSVHIDEIDNQHKVLFSLTRDLQQLLKGPELYNASLQELTSKLLSYTRYHFNTEEALMLAYCVDQEYISDHLEQHKQFLINIEEVVDRVSQVMDDRVSQVMREEYLCIFTYLANWLVLHVCKVDSRLDDFVNNSEGNLCNAQEFKLTGGQLIDTEDLFVCIHLIEQLKQRLLLLEDTLLKPNEITELNLILEDIRIRVVKHCPR